MTNSDSLLESPALNLAGSATPMLIFWHQYALESGYGLAWVGIGPHSGANWTALMNLSATQAA